MKAQTRNFGAMHLVTQRRPGVRRDYVTHLLRRSYREGGKVKKETIANLTHVPSGFWRAFGPARRQRACRRGLTRRRAQYAAWARRGAPRYDAPAQDCAAVG